MSNGRKVGGSWVGQLVFQSRSTPEDGEQAPGSLAAGRGVVLHESVGIEGQLVRSRKTLCNPCTHPVHSCSAPPAPSLQQQSRPGPASPAREARRCINSEEEQMRKCVFINDLEQLKRGDLCYWKEQKNQPPKHSICLAFYWMYIWDDFLKNGKSDTIN